MKWFRVDLNPDTFLTVGTGRPLALHLSAEPGCGLYATSERRYIRLQGVLDTRMYAESYFSAGVAPDVDVDADWYPTRQPVGIGTTTSAGVRFEHECVPGRWERGWYPGDSTYSPAYRDDRLDVGANVGLGPSFGRLRDATPVVLALLIGEALAGEGLLAKPLDDGAVQRLAQTLAGTTSLYYAHGRDWNRYFYAEIERVLRDAGCLDGRLPARAWLRIREITDGGPLLDAPCRTAGVKLSLRGGVDARVVRDCWSSQGERRETTTKRADYSGRAELLFGCPFTTRLHLNGSANVSATPLLGFRWLDAVAGVNLTYLLPDRMLAGINIDGYRHREYYGSPPSLWSERYGASVGSSLRFYVEDRSTLEAGVGFGGGGHRDRLRPWARFVELGMYVSLRHYF